MELVCSRCGAPLPGAVIDRAVTCAYCGANEAPRPRVVEKLVERVKVVEAVGGGLRCPRCGGALADAGYARDPVRVCQPCGGVWLEPAAIERLTRERDDDLVNAARLAVGAFAPRTRDRRPFLGCPFCARLLERRPLGELGEAYDVCPAHGTFFDHGELRTFVEAETARRAGAVDADDVRAAGIGGWRWPWS